MGWTNYTPCFPLEVQNLLEKVYDNRSDPQTKFQIAQNTRNMEIIGFSVSLVALLLSLFIFMYFRALHNCRTKIHANLFLAMIIQVVVRLVLYADQAFAYDDPKTLSGIASVPYLCEAFYILLEYAISAMFCWMFIEGLYLHHVVTANVMRERGSYRWHYLLGWGLPAITTGIWAVVTAMHYRKANVHQCWYGYNFLPEYWLCQGPRLVKVLINLLFLLNILRVLILKLNKSENSEMDKIKKAARAALVLLPLLGITNILNMVEAPLDGSVLTFGAWSYTTHFLRSFQGLLIALIYCFFNGEVRQVLKKQYTDWLAIRHDQIRRRKAAMRRRRRYASPLPGRTRNLEWVQSDGNNDIEADAGSDTGSARRCLQNLYNDPDHLEDMATIRMDDITNVTDGF